MFVHGATQSASPVMLESCSDLDSSETVREVNLIKENLGNVSVIKEDLDGRKSHQRKFRGT